MLTLDTIYQAAHNLKNIIRKTDLIHATNLPTNCDLHLKAENLQITGSFKVRGAYFKISNLSDAEKKHGVVACSAGNHAQGVALSAKKCGIKATIFLPAIAPISKIEATRQYGAEIKLIDGVYDDAFNAALAYQKKSSAVFIHPFDDYEIIAGQATIGLELLKQLPSLDAMVVPVGGGGLIAGIAFAVKKLNPSIKIYGVQAVGAGSMSTSFAKKERCRLENVSTFADGIAVKHPGELTYDLCAQYVDEIVTVTDDEIATAILSLMEKQKLVAEGAGAVAVAAIMFNKLPTANKKIVAIVSGGNIDVNILSRVIHRGLLTAGRLSDLNIELLDKPGQLREISTIIAELGANVTRVNHNFGGENTDINGCYLRITIETRNREHLNEVRATLIERHYKLS